VNSVGGEAAGRVFGVAAIAGLCCLRGCDIRSSPSGLHTWPTDSSSPGYQLEGILATVAKPKVLTPVEPRPR